MVSFCTTKFFSSKANWFKSSKSFNFLIEPFKEFIKSSNNFFSLITFWELILSCQKLVSSIFEFRDSSFE